jgi:hypothetical protein
VVKGGAGGVTDLAGNALATDATASFTTVAPPDTTPPTVTSFNPANGSTNVATNVSVLVTFSEALTASSVNSSTVQLMDGSTAVAVTVLYNATTFVATLVPTSGLANSRTYTIVVRGGGGGVKDLAGNALAADVNAAFTTVAPQTVPAAPSNLNAIAVSATRVNLSWKSNSTNEIGFRIYRSTDNGKTWTLVGQVGAGVTAFADTTVSARKTYRYRVQAYNNIGGSASSNGVSVSTPRL